jgi:hypothetical protein
MPENSEQILSDIQSLQQMEQQLFQSLEATPNISVEERQKVVQKMNELSNMRINLYKTLSGINGYFSNALKSSVGSLQEQVVAVGIVEQELNKSKKNLELLEAERNNKIRMVEINSYYGDKYSEHAELMKLVIYTLIPVIFLVLLRRSQALPTFLFNILLVIISAIGGYYFWMRYTSIIMRDNMNYQQYDWFFNASKAPAKKTSTVTGDPWASMDVGTCIGDTCCAEGLTYDTSLNLCIIPGTASSMSNSMSDDAFLISGENNANGRGGNANVPFTESMVSGVLTKTQPGKIKADYDLRELVAFNA